MSIGRQLRQPVTGDTLESGHFWLLKNLHSEGSMRVTDLAGCANLDISTVSRHVAQLQRTGLIARTPDPDDRRAQRVELTQLGEDQLRRAYEGRRTLLQQGMADWATADIEQLADLLARFVTNLESVNQDLEHP
jgi:DNA-binding MarR family transcriptional regulator